MAAKTIKLTRKALAEVPLGCGWVNVTCTDLKGVKLYSGKAKKALYLRRRINGSNRDFKICTWTSELSPEQITKKATTLAAQLVDGSHPSQQKKNQKIKKVTLGEAFERYIQSRCLGERAIKASTEEQYRFAYKTDLEVWEDRSLLEITGDDAERMHLDRSKTSPSRANVATRLLGQIFRFAMEVYRDEVGNPLITYNPADRISNLKLHNKLGRRTGVIRADQMQDWFKAVLSQNSGCGVPEMVADLFIFTLLTGLRRNEAAQLTWSQVDLENQSFSIIENKAGRPIELPLSDYLKDMLQKHKKTAGNRNYVFPAGRKSGYLKDWRRWCNAVGEEADLKFTPHDLRRTFITVAESLDISPYTIKALVNHSLPSDDVTGGYIQFDVERLRKPMQQITDYMLELARVA